MHTAYLDTLTLGFLDVWLREGRDRWSRTPNPHLLITQQTATDIVPVSDTFLRHCFAAVQITATRLREDRIMDEARHAADPVAPDAPVRCLRHHRHEVRLCRAPRPPDGPARQMIRGNGACSQEAPTRRPRWRAPATQLRTTDGDHA